MLNENNREGLLLVISSPSGGGKSTIYKALLEMGEPFGFSISATTRPPRTDEIDGVHYRFVSEDEFSEMVEREQFAEWANVHGCRYGSPKRFVDEALHEGKIMILEIDVQGASQLKKAYPENTVTVFVAPPSLDETETRLRKRGSNSEGEIRLRLSNASIEIRHSHDFDYIVLNSKIADAVADLLSIARSEHLATKRFIGDIWGNGGQNL